MTNLLSLSISDLRVNKQHRVVSAQTTVSKNDFSACSNILKSFTDFRT